jgi:hypothetical protein
MAYVIFRRITRHSPAWDQRSLSLWWEYATRCTQVTGGVHLEASWHIGTHEESRPHLWSVRRDWTSEQCGQMDLANLGFRSSSPHSTWRRQRWDPEYCKWSSRSPREHGRWSGKADSMIAVALRSRAFQIICSWVCSSCVPNSLFSSAGSVGFPETSQAVVLECSDPLRTSWFLIWQDHAS